MLNMLPIPAPIIGLASAKPLKSINSSSSGGECYYSHRKIFLPLIYLGGTASLCYLFLFALIVSNEKANNHRHHSHILHRPFEFLQLSLQGNNSEKQFYQSGLPQGSSESDLNNRNRKEGKNDQEQLSFSTTSQPHFHRKVLYSLRKKSERSATTTKNGTRRSNSPKIWSGHQDLDQLLRLTLTSQIKNGLHSKSSFPLEETYIYPWIEDAQCKNFKVQFAKRNTFKPRALVSFPGSGNTWIRYLIERASGYFTGSVYNDKSIFESGLLGELRKPNDGTTIVQKTHHDTVGVNKVYHEKETEWIFGYRGILIIRNPFDALVSYWNYMNSLSKDRHTGIASESEFKSKKWINFVLTRIPLWTSLITSWIKNSSSYLIIFYEDIQKNPRVELIRILSYLNLTVNAERLDCLMKPKHLEGPFHRSYPTNQRKKTLSEEVPLTDSTLFTTPAPASTSLQGKNWKMSPNNKNNLRRNDEQTSLSLLDSKQSQHQHQHPQSPSSLSKPPSQTTTAAAAELVRGKKEQKEDLISLSSLSPLKTISSTSSTQKQHQQNQDGSNSSTIRTMTRSNDNLSNNNNSNNNGPNNSSILRLDLIIQDNIDQINRFFHQKSIPLQLFYSPRPSTKPYFLPIYNPSTTFSSF